MRQLLIIIIVFFAVYSQAQQTPFEGRIVYNLHTPLEKEDASLTAYFGKGVLRLEFSAPPTGDKRNLEYLLVFPDSGIVYTVRMADKNYSISELKRKTVLPLPQAKEIAGYKTTPVLTGSGAANGMLAGILGAGVLHVANDLLFPVPETYEGSAELLMIRNNKIVLGAAFSIADDEGRSIQRDSAMQAQNILTATAVSVSPQVFDSTLFRIPAGYNYRDRYSVYNDSLYSDTTYAGTEIFPDSTAQVTPKKESKKKSRKAPVKKKTTTGQKALRRKE